MMKKLLFLLLFPLLAFGQRNVSVTLSGQRLTGGNYQHSGAGTYVRPVTIDNSGNPSALTDVQVLVTLTSANFTFANANTDGSDIRFTTTSHIPVPFWIQSYSNGSQTASIWINVSVGAASTATVWLWYGNSTAASISDFSATMERPSNTSDLVAGYLFDEGTGSTAADLKATNTATLNGNYRYLTDFYGGRGSSLYLDGANSYVDIPGILTSFGTEGTIALSFTPNTTITAGSLSTDPRLVLKSNNGVSDFLDLLIDHTTAKLRLRVYRGAVNTVDLYSTQVGFTAGTKYELAITWNSTFIFVYVNGVRQIRSYLATNALPQDDTGSGHNLAIGAYNATGTASNFANITIDDVAIYNAQKLHTELAAMAGKRKWYAKDEATKWTKQPSMLISDTYTTGQSTAEEPTLLYQGGFYWLYYTVGPIPTLIRLKKATTLAGLAAASATTVLGNGTGGQSGDVYRNNVYYEGGTFYLYYGNSITASDLKCVTSSNGTTFSSPVVVAPASGSNYGSSMTNSYVVKSGSTYLLLIESYNAATTNFYRTGRWTGSTPNGTFTCDATNPKTSLSYNTGANYITSGPWVQSVTSGYRVWTHQGTDVGGRDNNIYALDCADDLQTFTKPYTEPVMRYEKSYEFNDQIADPSVIYDGTQCIMMTDLVKNAAPFTAYIGVQTFAGTLEQLKNDLTVTVSSPIP